MNVKGPIGFVAVGDKLAYHHGLSCRQDLGSVEICSEVFILSFYLKLSLLIQRHHPHNVSFSP